MPVSFPPFITAHERQGRITKLGLKVSMTLHPGQGRYVPQNIYELLDRIHFMTYDMIHGGGGSSNGVGKSSNGPSSSHGSRLLGRLLALLGMRRLGQGVIGVDEALARRLALVARSWLVACNL